MNYSEFDLVYSRSKAKKEVQKVAQKAAWIELQHVLKVYPNIGKITGTISETSSFKEICRVLKQCEMEIQPQIQPTHEIVRKDRKSMLTDIGNMIEELRNSNVDISNVPIVSEESNFDRIDYAEALLHCKMQTYRTNRKILKLRKKICQCIDSAVDSTYCNDCWDVLGSHPYCDRCRKLIYKRRLIVTLTQTDNSNLFQFANISADQVRRVILCWECYGDNI